MEKDVPASDTLAIVKKAFASVIQIATSMSALQPVLEPIFRLPNV